MNPSWRKYLARPAPRYTSYPSALHFDNAVTVDDYLEKLDGVGLYEPLSLYAHVPFCRQLCWYCGCNMRVENRYRRAAPYVDALIEEVRRCGAALGGRGRTTSMHFGGGTPNYLTHADLGRIVAAIEQELGLTDDATLAIEIDPRLIGEGDIAGIVALGFNRISLGVQDFDPAVQAAINRRQSFELVEARVADIRTAGVRDLSFDILYGLPGQTLPRFAATIEKAISLAPDRMSVFGYAHLPKAAPAQRMIDAALLPDDALRGELAALADEALVAGGYRRIGFDHYAKPDNALARAVATGRLRRNFQGFTDDAARTLLAFGASAVSFIDGLYVQNEKKIADYVARVGADGFAIARGASRTRRESVVAAAITDLLCTMTTNISEVLRQSPPADAIRICSALEQLEADGVISWRDDVVAMAPGAHILARAVAAAMDPYVTPQVKFAAAV